MKCKYCNKEMPLSTQNKMYCSNYHRERYYKLRKTGYRPPKFISCIVKGCLNQAANDHNRKYCISHQS